MASLIKRFLFFCILLIVISYPVARFIGNNFYTFNKQNWILKLKNRKYDYAVLGSSRVANMIDIKTIDSVCAKKGINIGTSGSNYAENYLMLSVFLKNNHINKLIINVDESSMNSNKSVAGFPFHVYEFLPVSDDGNYNVIFKDFVPQWKQIAWRYIPILKYIEFNDKFTIKPSENIELEATQGSQLLDFDSFEHDQYQRVNRIPDQKDIDYFTKIANLCKEKNIEILIITTPIYEEMANEKEQHYVAFINQFCEQYAVQYISFESIFDFSNKTYFANRTHTNKKGSLAYSKNLGEALKKDFLN